MANKGIVETGTMTLKRKGMKDNSTSHADDSDTTVNGQCGVNWEMNGFSTKC